MSERQEQSNLAALVGIVVAILALICARKLEREANKQSGNRSDA